MKQAKQRIFYDKKSDALWLLIKSGIESEHKEIAPGVSVELSPQGELLGVEILNASKVLVPKIQAENKQQQRHSIPA